LHWIFPRLRALKKDINMHHVPQPQDQARILKSVLETFGIPLPHRKALEAVARVMGYKDWQTHSAAFTQEQAAKHAKAQALQTIPGPADGDLYEALVTVDQTLSARIRVRAHSDEEARQALSSAGAAQYPHGFEVDEGNYRGTADFYLGDPDAIENLSEPELYDNDDFWAKATWRDEQFGYEIELSRDEPDVSNDERRSKVTCFLRLSRDGATQEQQSRLNVYGHLGTYLEECIEEGDFDENFAKLTKRLTTHLRKHGRV
jgi:hypothetical protein